MEVMNKTVVLRVPASFRDGGREMMSDKLFQFQDWVVSSSRFLSSYLHIYLSTYLNIYISTCLHIYTLSTIPGLSCVVLSVLVLTVSSGLLARRYKQGKTYQIEIDKEMWVLVFLYIYLLKVSSVFSKYCEKRFVASSICLPIAHCITARTSCHQMRRFSLCCFAFSR